MNTRITGLLDTCGLLVFGPCSWLGGCIKRKRNKAQFRYKHKPNYNTRIKSCAMTRPHYKSNGGFISNKNKHLILRREIMLCSFEK